LDAKPARVVVTGSTGLVGRALVASLEQEGHDVLRLVRREPAPGAAEARWDPDRGTIDAAALEGADALVHLAGASIAASRWTERRKREIAGSRVRGTRLVGATLAALRRPPRVLVSASAIGYYGNRGDEPLDEDSPQGTGFLAETCREWEAAARTAEPSGARIVLLRTGIVLARDGGALPRMLLPFRLGLGGRIGSGRQHVSWIGLGDMVGVIRFALSCDRLAGPVNAVAPGPVTNAEFTRTLSGVLRRPAWIPLPAFAVRLALGQLGRELLLEGARVVPRKLARAGYAFRHGDLRSALEAELS
jgi:uncharacterized protein (TIGR01777 family)